MISNKKNQVLNIANNKLLDGLLRSMQQTNQVLCEIRDQSSGGNSQKNVETALQSVPRSGEVPQRIVAGNPDRLALWICNSADVNLMIAPFHNISSDQFSAIIAPNKMLRIQINEQNIYTNAIYGFWAEDATGAEVAMVTEFFPAGDYEEYSDSNTQQPANHKPSA